MRNESILRQRICGPAVRMFAACMHVRRFGEDIESFIKKKKFRLEYKNEVRFHVKTWFFGLQVLQTTSTVYFFGF